MSIRSAIGKLLGDGRSAPLTSLELRSNSLNNPSVPLSAAGFLAWATGSEPTASGEQVTVNTALQLITVYACVRVLAGSIASLPLYVYEQTPDGHHRAEDHPLARLLRWEPNPEMTTFTFLECLVGSMALAGNAYAEIQRDNGRRVVALWPLHPQLTEPKRSPGGALVYETMDGMMGGRSRTLAAEDVLHVPLFSFQGLKGLSPIQMARQGIGLAIGAQKFGARFFGNGARPSGILTASGTLTDKQKAEARESWNQMQGGENAGSTAVLPGNWDYKQIGISPEDSQFLETRQFQRADISAGLYGVPPHMIGDLTRLSNNNHEQMSLSFVTDTLRPYMARIEAEMMRKLFPNVGRGAGRFHVQFDVSERLRGDFKTTMDGYAVGKQWGFFSTNDVLRDMGRNPIGPVGDVYWVPVNTQNAERLLDTESIQDQPLAPKDPPPAVAGVDDKPATVEGERDLLGRFTRAYISVFSAEMDRLLRRNRRDSEAIAATLGPVLRSIAEHSAEACGLSEMRTVLGIVEDAQRSIASRAAKWPEKPKDEAAAQITRQEFLRVLRSIYTNVARERAAQQALAQLGSITEGA